MKNNFVATFTLLAAGLVFNDVASVEGKPTKRDLRGWQGWQIEKVHREGTDAIYRCHGTFSNYKQPEQCNKAGRIESTLADLCGATDPIACKLLFSMKQAERTALQGEAADTVKRMSEN